jgi:hypothetical protein
MKKFDDYRYGDARKLFVNKDGTERRTPTAILATQFRKGNHWQNGKGFIGEKPIPGQAGFVPTMLAIKNGFVSENVVGEVVGNHDSGVLGREPVWSFLQIDSKEPIRVDKKVYEPLTTWWNDREVLNDLQESVRIMLCEEITVRRIYIPQGLLDEQGKDEEGKLKPSGDVVKALELVYTETLTSDVAGVFTDPATQRQIGVYLFERELPDGSKQKCAELSYLNPERQTVHRVVVDGTSEPEEFGPYDLGGRLLIYEMRREALITEQVQSNQKALNLAHTMMMRNVNLAGNRDTTITNAQHPKAKKKIATAEGVKEVMEDAPHVKGAGAVMYLLGRPIYNEKSQVIGYTNPNVIISDPVPVETFKETRDHFYAAILGQCQQRHKLISGDATASGRSREQARAEYEGSLKATKSVVDAAGRWQLETVLRLAAQLAGKTSEFINLRADFNSLIDTGPLSPTERQENRADVKDKLLAPQTAMSRNNVEDTDAEYTRMEEDAKQQKKLRDLLPPIVPPPSEDKTGDKLSA